MLDKKFLMCLVALVLIPVLVVDVLGHGLGVDRAPHIDFENRDVTVITKMNPSDMTVGDFSNAFMEVRFVEVFEIFSDKKIKGHICVEKIGGYSCKYDVPIKQTTFAVEVFKEEALLARQNFYAEDGILTVDIRPNNSCSIKEENPWMCTKYFGTEHPLVVNALYTFGQNNPVIDGAIFTEGGMYEITVKVLGAESPRSNLKDPLVFDLYISIAQEQLFWLNPETGQVFDSPKAVF